MEKRIKTRICALVVVGMFVAMLYLPGIIAPDGETKVETDGNYRIDIDNDNDEDDRNFTVSHDDGTELFRVQENGKVGINTTSPGAILDVAGAIKSSVSTPGTILFRGNNEAGTPTTDGFRIRFQSDFFGGSYDALIIEKTDGNQAKPDDGHSGIAFVNTGEDGEVETAMVIKGDGKVGIGIKSPGDTLDVNGDIRVRGADIKDAGGTTRIAITDNGRLDLKEDGGSTSLSIATNGKVGIGTTSPGAKLDVEVSSGGAATIGSSSNSATGNYAIALGDGTTASGICSTAMGSGTGAIGDYSTAMGSGTTAFGELSTSMGLLTIANGHSSTAMGELTMAMGYASTAMGMITLANADMSTAMGTGTVADGIAATAMGENTMADGYAATTTGSETIASGNYSTAMGRAIIVSNTATNSFGIGLDSTARTINQPNTMAIMGGKVGIGTVSPSEILELNGAITIGAATGTTTGTIQWDPVSWDFEGYDGSNWVSLTSTGVGGMGTANRIPKFQTATNLTDSLIYESTGCIAISSNPAMPIPVATLDVDGGLATNTVYVNATLFPAGYTAGPTDFLILVDTSSGPVTVNLPSAATVDGQILVIKKIDATIGMVTIASPTSDFIDGTPTPITFSAQWTTYSIQASGPNPLYPGQWYTI